MGLGRWPGGFASPWHRKHCLQCLSGTPICLDPPSELAGLNTAIARYEREIALLREYRTRLTADVVTGKLDVRAAAAQLPEEAEEGPLPDPELPEEETELEEVEG